jgi:hypothetical protein
MMRDFHKGVWQMSLAMLISGSIGAFVLLSGLPVTEVVFWRCLIGAMALFIFIRASQKPFSPSPAPRCCWPFSAAWRSW